MTRNVPDSALQGDYLSIVITCAIYVFVGFAIWHIYILVRPCRPETLVLMASGLDYDSGERRPEIAPEVTTTTTTNGFAPNTFDPNMTTTSQSVGIVLWNNAPKPIRFHAPAQDIERLTLHREEHENRLTLDHGVDRIEIASDCTEIEREWLYGFVRAQYGV
jgi:hypothetical protein